MEGDFITAIAFLIKVIFGFYIFATLLRFLLACVRADFYNPVSQLVIRVTDPAIKPLRRLIPGYWNIDWSTVVLLFVAQMVEILLLTLLIDTHPPVLLGLLVLTLAHLLKELIYLYIFIILIQVVVSWLTPGVYSPVILITQQLSEPLLKRARKLIAPTAGLDFAPLIVLVLLQLCLMLPVTRLMQFGLSLVY